jgi:hypothetical protein
MGDVLCKIAFKMIYSPIIKALFLLLK